MTNKLDIIILKQEAREAGLAEGRAKVQTEIAKRMLADNMPIEAVVKYSGLSEEQVRALTA